MDGRILGQGRAVATGEPPGDEGPDEATALIAAALAPLAQRHRLGMRVRLLEMAPTEPEERVRLRGKRNQVVRRDPLSFTLKRFGGVSVSDWVATQYPHRATAGHHRRAVRAFAPAGRCRDQQAR